MEKCALGSTVTIEKERCSCIVKNEEHQSKLVITSKEIQLRID